ncbi:hypothetical protein [Serratia marcescens]|uniref:hypothetical protein n=1 Tax=Serratia marcescens TaxID=615 RepID=UPI003989792A
MSRFTERSYCIAAVVLTVLGCYFGYQTVVDILRVRHEDVMISDLLVGILLLLLTGSAALWSLRKAGDAADYRRWLEKRYEDER